ncbi:MAG: hypothetical protein ACO1SV_25505 [Fimbriimonas sp.]
MTKRWARWLTALPLAFMGYSAHAADQTANTAPAAQKSMAPTGKLSDFLTGSGLQIKFSSKSDFLGKKNEQFVGVFLKDVSLFEKGTAADPLDLGLDQDPIKFGDAPLTLKLGESLSEVGGTLLSSLGVYPLTFPGLEGSKLRILAGLDAQLEQGNQSTGFAGIEWLPTGAYAADSETFIGLSARYEQRTDDNDTIQTAGTASLRARLGFGIKFALSDERVRQIRNDIANIANVPDEKVIPYVRALAQERHLPYDSFLLLALTKPIDQRAQRIQAEINALEEDLGRTPPPTNQEELRKKISDKNLDLKRFDDAYKYFIKVDGGKVEINDSRVKEIMAGNIEPFAKAAKLQQDPDKARMIVKEMFQYLKQNLISKLAAKEKALLDEIEKAAPNNPLLSFFGEFDGSHIFSGEDIAGKRQRGVFSLNARYTFNPKDENAPYLWLRWERGRTRAEPDKEISGLLVMAGFRF